MLPSWAPAAIAAVTIALPLLIAGGHSAVQRIDGAPRDPIQPVDRSSVFEDTDEDGLPNLLENYVYGTDPNASRSFSETVPDGYLARHGYDPSDPAAEEQWTAHPSASQTPEGWGEQALPPSHRVTVRELYTWDRPDDYDENSSGPWDNGLDPQVWRSPSGLPVPWLLTYGLDPVDEDVGAQVLAPEPEGDGLTVAESYASATDPRALDTDGDGIDDRREWEQLATDASSFSTAGGGVADGWAIRHALNATDPRMPFEDPDNDGLSNSQEFNASVELYGLDAVLDGEGLDPHEPSTGSSPIPDGWLVAQGLDPLDTGVEREPLSCASDHEVPRDIVGLPDVCLTVLDAYTYQRPTDWEESRRGPWMGGLSARTNDTDGDGLPDPVELRGWNVNVSSGVGSQADAQQLHVTPDPLSADTDGDGLGDRGEMLGEATVGDVTVAFNATDPENRDTDFDGLSDGREVLAIPRQLSEHYVEGTTLDPTRRDTDGDALEDGREWFLLRDRAERCRDASSEYGFGRARGSVGDVLASIAERTDAVPPEGDSVCGLLEPWGDPDADQVPNILDRDSDDDGLWDGWESDPSTYDQSPWASVHPRSRTDLVNPDSDADHLPDGWEVQYGEWNQTLQSFNLDPSRWSSFGDDVGDADRDLDDDAITWSTFHRTVDGFGRSEHEFVATNLVEYRNGTDPNDPRTTDSPLLDGWTIFWGIVYPSLDADEIGDVYPGQPGPFFVDPSQPRPNPSTGENPVLDTVSVKRFTADGNRGDEERLVRTFEDVQTADGRTITADLLERTVERTFHFEQETGTNPYLADTDGDGVPDGWEAAVGDELHPHPLVHERGTDEDDDGLVLEREHQRSTSPALADTDLGGVDDGEELDAGRNPLDPGDDISVTDPDADLDCDGVEDVRESDGWDHPSQGRITTNPLSPDTDRDGLLDGFTRVLSQNEDASCIATLRQHGVLSQATQDGDVEFLGEAGNRGDPRKQSTSGDAVPDGFLVWWEFEATDRPAHVEEVYHANRPSWWTETSMGPWMWGPAPVTGSDVDGDGRTDWRTQRGSFVLADRDLDEDGLDDVNGEDPTPGARPELAPPDGWPDGTALTDKESRSRGASFGLAPDDRGRAAGRDTDGNGVPDASDQLPVAIQDLQLEGAPRPGDRHQLSQTETYLVTGRVLADADEGRVPAENATAIAELVDADHPVGAAFTDEEGRFAINVSLSGERAVQVPEGLVLFERTDRLVSWSVDVTGLPRGAGPSSSPNTLHVRVTNTSGAVQPGEPTYLGAEGPMDTGDGRTVVRPASGIEATISEPVPVSLTTISQLSLDVASQAPPGARLPVAVTLTDASGEGLPNETVRVAVGDESAFLTTDEDGTVRTAPTLPEGLGQLPVQASFDGGPFTRPSTAQANLTIKRPTSLQLTSIDPAPVTAGRNVTVAGHLQAPGEALHPINVTTPAGTRSTTSEAGGGFQARLAWPAEAVGTATVAISFDGNDTLLGDTAEAEVDVQGGSRLSLSTSRDVLAPGDPLVLRTRLTDARGTPLAGESLRLTGVPGQDVATVTTDATGTASIEAKAPAEPGSTHVSARFPGTHTHAGDRAIDWINVSVPARVSLEVPEPVNRGSVVTVSGTLDSATGATIPHQPVTLHALDREVDTVLTGSDGSFEVIWALDEATPLGRAELEARFNGTNDGGYQAATGLGATTIQEGLNVSPRILELQHGLNPVSLDVRLDSGRPAPDGRLTLRAPTLNLSVDTEVSDARAQPSVPVHNDAQLGEHPLEISYEPSIEIPSSRIQSIAQILTPVEFRNVTRAVAERGETVAISGILDPGRGDPPTGQFGASFLGEAQQAVVERGRFTLELAVPANASAGDYTLELAWARQGGYLEAREEVPVIVREAVSLDIDLSTGGPGDPVQGTVSLRTGDDEPVRHESVLLKNDEGLAFLVRTDEEGQARLSLPAPGHNETNYTFHFAGRGTLASATAATTLAAPASPGPNPWLLGGLASLALGVLVGAVAWYVRRRRRALAATLADELEESHRRLEAGSEYEAVILQAYDVFVRLLAEHEVAMEDPDTLGDFQRRIERVLGVQGTPIEELFSVFDETLYGPGTPGRSQRNRAISAFQGAVQLLRERAESDQEEAT